MSGITNFLVNVADNPLIDPEGIVEQFRNKHLMTAAQLAKAMSAEIQLAGYRVIGD